MSKFTDAPSTAQHDRDLIVSSGRPSTRSDLGDPTDASQNEQLLDGTVVGRFVIDRCIGQGGFGIVYAAHDRQDGRRVAIKVLRRCWLDTPRIVQRFVREAQALQQINHPNVVTIYELGTIADGRRYITMEYVDGPPLSKALVGHHRFSLAQTVEIMKPLCSALQAVHEVGIVHRDIKPSNVLLADDGGRRVIKLVDFGIAKLLESEQAGSETTAGRLLGTLHAMSPEQITGEALDARTDVYGLGILLFEMLVGRHPFATENHIDLITAHLESPVPRPSEIAPLPSSIDAVVLRCLHKQREHRFASTRAVWDGLQRAAAYDDAPEKQSGRALAILVEGLLTAERTRQPDTESLLDELLDILDIAEEELVHAGYTISQQTRSGILGVQIVSPPATPSSNHEPERHRALDFAHSLYRQLVDRPGRLRIDIRVVLHFDAIEVLSPASNQPGSERDIAARMKAWIPSDITGGVYATQPMRADIDDSQ